MEKYCQSCGMPMGQGQDLYGSEVSGEKSHEYCKYCYENGLFTYDGDLAGMIEICVKPMVEANPDMSEDVARNMMQKFLPHLKRWSK